jgi:hypothetical protein
MTAVMRMDYEESINAVLEKRFDNGKTNASRKLL